MSCTQVGLPHSSVCSHTLLRPLRDWVSFPKELVHYCIRLTSPALDMCLVLHEYLLNDYVRDLWPWQT